MVILLDFVVLFVYNCLVFKHPLLNPALPFNILSPAGFMIPGSNIPGIFFQTVFSSVCIRGF